MGDKEHRLTLGPLRRSESFLGLKQQHDSHRQQHNSHRQQYKLPSNNFRRCSRQELQVFSRVARRQASRYPLRHALRLQRQRLPLRIRDVVDIMSFPRRGQCPK